MSEAIVATVRPSSPPVSWTERVLEACKRRERLALILAASFQFVVLLAAIGLAVWPRLTGDTILLRVVPVDPRDLFRGDYVVLSYEFSRLGRSNLPGPKMDGQFQQGQQVFITLVPESDGRHYRASGWSLTRPSGEKYIAGHYTDFGRIDCGIEQYFVQEGKGHDYENAIRSHGLSAEVALTPDGTARLLGLRIEKR